MIFKLALLSLLFVPSISYADEFDKLFPIVDKYISSVTCEDQINVDDLRVFKVSTHESTTDAYVVVWSGDKGCYGGSGAGNTFVTPVVLNPSGRLVVSTEGELKIQAREYSAALQINKNLIFVDIPKYEENDPNCCPSGSEQYYIKYDAIEQKVSRVHLKKQKSITIN